MEAKQKVALTFALYHGEVLVRRETTTTDIVKVGRDPKSHLRVEDALACRMHAVIEAASAECVTVIDLGNEPGTMVNGQRVSKRRITPGDQLTVGETTIIFEKAEAVAVAAQPAALEPRANPFAPMSLLGAPAETFAWNNPFASAQQEPSVAEDEVPADAPEGSYTFALVKNGPDMLPEECEGPSSAIEVMILWDATVLHVSHLTPPRSFYVGEEQSKNVACDYFLPSERLGATRAPVVLVDRRGEASLVILPRAKGTIEIAGQPKMTVEDALARGLTQACAELTGAAQMPFPQGSKAAIEVDGLTFKVAAVNAGRAVAAAPILTESLPYHGISAFVHASLLAAMAFLMPSLGATTDDAIGSDQSFKIRQYLDVAGETNRDAKPAEDLAEVSDRNESEGGKGQRSAGEEGAMGNPLSKATGNRYAIEGPKDNEDPRIARERALREARDFGMVGILNSGAGGDPNAPIAPWGGADSLGNDPLSALGGMWGRDIGDSYGAGGLGLSGVGELGGGRGEGIGLGMIGTIGHGSGGGDNQGFGRHSGRLPSGHRVASPIVRIGQTTASGHLPPEVIQRIVRQNFGRFRLCYENGLRSSPNLQGRVAVRFIIGRDGAVSSVGNGGSDMPDSGVVSCVVRAFYGLSFPAPESGIVTVVYPIMFSPGAS